jgi:hypothetical protein
MKTVKLISETLCVPLKRTGRWVMSRKLKLTVTVYGTASS